MPSAARRATGAPARLWPYRRWWAGGPPLRAPLAPGLRACSPGSSAAVSAMLAMMSSPSTPGCCTARMPRDAKNSRILPRRSGGGRAWETLSSESWDCGELSAVGCGGAGASRGEPAGSIDRRGAPGEGVCDLLGEWRGPGLGHRSS